MKKSLILVLTFSLIAVITVICIVFNKNSVKTLTCTIKGRLTNGTEINNEYIVKYKGKYVKEVKSVEEATTKDQEALNIYKQSVEELYSKNKDIKYYDYDLKQDGNTLTSIVIINYEKIDIDALINANPSNGNLIKDKKILLEDIKEEYIKSGATCK